jgi:hypothetical protein
VWVEGWGLWISALDVFCVERFWVVGFAFDADPSRGEGFWVESQALHVGTLDGASWGGNWIHIGGS